ncbi:MAG: hypothetical protein PHF21_02320 [Bacilli bacterium]|nr:hypothetical protein [Bacilli bacterium]
MIKKITEEYIKGLASKLMFDITKEETESVTGKLEYLNNKLVDMLKLEDLKKHEPQTHAFDLYESKLRDDENVLPGTDVSLLLANAKKVENNEIEVPKVVG